MEKAVNFCPIQKLLGAKKKPGAKLFLPRKEKLILIASGPNPLIGGGLPPTKRRGISSQIEPPG